MSAFPLPFERIQWRTRRLAVSDFRLVTLRGGRVLSEIALHDIDGIQVAPAILERLTGIGTLEVTSARRGEAAVRLPGLWGARRAALRLTLLVADLRGVPPGEGVADLPLPGVWRLPTAVRLQAALVAPALILLAVVAIGIGLSGHTVPVGYGADDPVRPHGVRRSEAEIVAFMEQEVMPWAREALAPVAGRDRVTCETCHGRDAAGRQWQMPAVSALPEPDVRRWAEAGSDAQMRNALHGYLAEGHNLAIAAHMRAVVVPGMAALLRRPAYDFAQTYQYNRARAALGCYHCHMVRSDNGGQ